MSTLADKQARAQGRLRLSNGGLVWEGQQSAPVRASAVAPAQVTIADRNGTPLWRAGAPTKAASEAGLAPMLGVHAQHSGSIAGMLARLPSGAPQTARLTIDLDMQAGSHALLDCLGMRRGHWDGARCVGGQPVPPGRRAGMLILDAGTGDVLAAAGAGAGAVDTANWGEVRDFDRANPARSPLRLPALQHDGGAHNSPGSTFKIISALGLELAAQRDRELDTLLGGMALPAINRVASDKGYAFRTNAASFPADAAGAHITNHRRQGLDRRARDGRLGLAQALSFSLNTWFAWTAELSDRSLFGRAGGGLPGLQALEAGALDRVRPIANMARVLGFGQALRLDGGLLPPGFAWEQWDALQASAARIDPIHTRHELRQMAIGLRMQVTPLQMALVAAAVGQGGVVAPRLMLSLNGREAAPPRPVRLGVRLDRIRAGMKGVVDQGTASTAFGGAALAQVRRGLSGKTGTAPSLVRGVDGKQRELATVWFTGWLEPGSLPGQTRRLAVAAFASHSEASGADHAAPLVAAMLASLASRREEQKGK